MSSTDVSSLQRLLDEGVAEGVFPAAQAVVLSRGQEIFEGVAGSCSSSTAFDLASLTKILCTANLMAWALGRGVAVLEMPLSHWIPELPATVHEVTLEDVLFHRAGYAASVPLWAQAMRDTPALQSFDCPPEVRLSARRAVLEEAYRVLPVRPNRQAAVYCDIGFILLGEALERMTKVPLDLLFAREISERLKSALAFHRLSELPLGAFRTSAVAPSGMTRPRELAPEQPPPPGPEVPKAQTRTAEVDDDNAFVLDGVAGHAGLFGTAQSVAAMGKVWIEELRGAGRVAPASVWQRMLARDPLLKDSTRTLGFDTPSAVGSSAGTVFGRRGPLGAVGHLGFTGVSLWVDLDREWVCALVTNRTFLGRHVMGIREFRPRFHDAVAAVLRESSNHGG